MQQNVVLCGRGVVLCVAPAPVIADGVREDAAVVAVRGRRDGLVALLHRLEPLLGVLQGAEVRKWSRVSLLCAQPARSFLTVLHDLKLPTIFVLEVVVNSFRRTWARSKPKYTKRP